MHMKIELKLFASLERYMPEGSSRHAPRKLDVEEGTTIQALLEELRVPIPSVKTIFLNSVHAQGDEILKDGDRIGVFPPVAGE